MLGWLRSWRERRRLQGRGLFVYHDGARTRYGDPFRLYRALDHHPKMDLDKHAPLCDAGQEPETTLVVDSVCEIFGLARWNDATRAGLTDWEVLGVLNRFAVFIDSLKKSTSPTLTLLEPTGLPPSTSQDSPVPLTSEASDSGSMPSASSCEPPTEPSTASRQPSTA